MLDHAQWLAKWQERQRMQAASGGHDQERFLLRGALRAGRENVRPSNTNNDMNKLEPVIAFIDQRIIHLPRATPVSRLETKIRIEELQMIRALCTGLIEQDKLLQNALRA